MHKGLKNAVIFAAATLLAGAAAGQQIADTGFRSVGRGWPLAADLREYELTGPAIPITFANGAVSRGSWDDFIQALTLGQVYANVHSAVNPGGEIRGQVLPVQ